MYLLYQMRLTTNVRIQLIGYERKIVTGMWNCGSWKTVASQIMRKMQAPSREDITGMRE